MRRASGFCASIRSAKSSRSCVSLKSCRAAAANAAYRPAKPMDNTDFDLSWRKQMTRVYVTRALEELRARC